MSSLGQTIRRWCDGARGLSRTGPPPPTTDRARVERYLARLEAADRPAEQRRVLRLLTDLAAHEPARAQMAQAGWVARLLGCLAAAATPSHDAYDLGYGLRGGAGDREVHARLAVFAAAGELLARLGRAVDPPLRELLLGPPLPVGRVFDFGAEEPLLYGPKLLAVDHLTRRYAGDLRLWRRVAEGEAEPWTALAAALLWAQIAPHPAAAAMLRRVCDHGFGRACEVRYYAKRLRPMADALGQAAAAYVRAERCPIHRRLELLCAELAGDGWTDAAMAEQARTGALAELQALNRLLEAIDPARLERLRAEEGGRLSRCQPPSEQPTQRSIEGSTSRALRFGAVVLAAGRGERLGGGKLALPWGRSTILGTVLAALESAGVEPRHVVLGHAPERLAHILTAAGAVGVVNEAYADGMLTSVQRGLRSLPEVDAVVLLPGDQPLVSPRTIRRLIAAWQTTDGMLIPTYLYQSGHPVLIARRLFPLIDELDPAVGLRQLRERVPEQLRYLAVADPGILTDIDTPGDYLLHRPAGTRLPDELAERLTRAPSEP